MAIIGNLYTKVSADIAPFQKGMRGAMSSSKQMQQNVNMSLGRLNSSMMGAMNIAGRFGLDTTKVQPFVDSIRVVTDILPDMVQGLLAATAAQKTFAASQIAANVASAAGVATAGAGVGAAAASGVGAAATAANLAAASANTAKSLADAIKPASQLPTVLSNAAEAATDIGTSIAEVVVLQKNISKLRFLGPTNSPMEIKAFIDDLLVLRDTGVLSGLSLKNLAKFGVDCEEVFKNIEPIFNKLTERGVELGNSIAKVFEDLAPGDAIRQKGWQEWFESISKTKNSAEMLEGALLKQYEAWENLQAQVKDNDLRIQEINETLQKTGAAYSAVEKAAGAAGSGIDVIVKSAEDVAALEEYADALKGVESASDAVAAASAAAAHLPKMDVAGLANMLSLKREEAKIFEDNIAFHKQVLAFAEKLGTENAKKAVAASREGLARNEAFLAANLSAQKNLALLEQEIVATNALIAAKQRLAASEGAAVAAGVSAAAKTGIVAKAFAAGSNMAAIFTVGLVALWGALKWVGAGLAWIGKMIWAVLSAPITIVIGAIIAVLGVLDAVLARIFGWTSGLQGIVNWFYGIGEGAEFSADNAKKFSDAWENAFKKFEDGVKNAQTALDKFTTDPKDALSKSKTEMNVLTRYDAFRKDPRFAADSDQVLMDWAKGSIEREQELVKKQEEQKKVQDSIIEGKQLMSTLDMEIAQTQKMQESDDQKKHLADLLDKKRKIADSVGQALVIEHDLGESIKNHRADTIKILSAEEDVTREKERQAKVADALKKAEEARLETLKKIADLEKVLLDMDKAQVDAADQSHMRAQGKTEEEIARINYLDGVEQKLFDLFSLGQNIDPLSGMDLGTAVGLQTALDTYMATYDDAVAQSKHGDLVKSMSDMVTQLSESVLTAGMDELQLFEHNLKKMTADPALIQAMLDMKKMEMDLNNPAPAPTWIDPARAMHDIDTAIGGLRVEGKGSKEIQIATAKTATNTTAINQGIADLNKALQGIMAP